MWNARSCCGHMALPRPDVTRVAQDAAYDHSQIGMPAGLHAWRRHPRHENATVLAGTMGHRWGGAARTETRWRCKTDRAIQTDRRLRVERRTVLPCPAPRLGR